MTNKVKKLLTQKEFSLEYGPSRTTIWKMIRSGQLTAKKRGKLVVIRREDAEAWAESLPQIESD